MECCDGMMRHRPVTTMDGTRFGIAVLALPIGPGVDHYCDHLLGQNSFRYACRSVQEAWELAGERPWLKIRGDEPDSQIGGMLRDVATAWQLQATMQEGTPRDRLAAPEPESRKVRRRLRTVYDFMASLLFLALLSFLVSSLAVWLKGICLDGW